jgi:hypothetical protein
MRLESFKLQINSYSLRSRSSSLWMSCSYKTCRTWTLSVSSLEVVYTQNYRRVLPAVEVKQNARPPRHDVAMVPSEPARGIESRRPMTVCKLAGRNHRNALQSHLAAHDYSNWYFIPTPPYLHPFHHVVLVPES